ncbi:MAG: hypothetical protein Q9167_004652 [Letrouitia subvulpina]
MKYVQDVDTPIRAFEPLLLLGLLANYNKFEFRNPYRLRLEDFVNESTVQKIVQGIGANCANCRDGYVLIQDDVEEGWTLSNTLRYIGLGVLAPSRPSTPVPNAEEAKEKFSTLPNTTAAILLLTYDFIIANKLFSFSLISQPNLPNSKEPPFSAFLSLTSYILHHAYRSVRASLYGLLNLLTLRLLTEDSSICSKLFLPASALSVRLCRQRQPFLPSTPSSRPPAAAILDICLDMINHNLRRRLDIPLYTAALNVIHRLLSHCSATPRRARVLPAAVPGGVRGAVHGARKGSGGPAGACERVLQPVAGGGEAGGGKAAAAQPGAGGQGDQKGL